MPEVGRGECSMKNSQLVTVITPAFNASKTILESINSVRAQTYREFELIVVDDGSTDETFGTLERLAAEDPRIRPIRLERNGGTPAAAKNVALDMAEGEFIAFLDADDLWEPTKLELQVKEISKAAADLCFTAGWKIDEEGNVIGEFSVPQRVGDLFPELLLDYRINNQTVMLRRTALQKLAEPRFNTSILIGEDFELFMRIAAQSRVLSLSKKTAYYRCYEGSTSRRNLERAHEGVEALHKWMSADENLTLRHGNALRMLEAKISFYRAHALMQKSDSKSALRHLRPYIFYDARFVVLALLTQWPKLWNLSVKKVRSL